MRWVEVASIMAGLGIGYWLVSVFMHRDENAQDELTPPLDAVEPTANERPWYEVLNVSEWASEEAVKAAYRSKISENHPDKVATMGAEIRALATLKTREINDAYREAMRRY